MGLFNRVLLIEFLHIINDLIIIGNTKKNFNLIKWHCGNDYFVGSDKKNGHWE